MVKGGTDLFASQQGAAAKTPAVKAEGKEEPQGAKGPQGKGQRADAAAKGPEKKPAVAKGKPAVKDEEPAPNGKATAAPKKGKEEGRQPREKKEYDMPGQTREPPPEVRGAVGPAANLSRAAAGHLCRCRELYVPE